MKEDRLDNIYNVNDAINKLIKENPSNVIVRSDFIKRIDKMNRFHPGSIRSGIDHWVSFNLRENKIARVEKGKYKLL